MRKKKFDVVAKFKECRVYGHNWDTTGVEFRRTQIVVELTCMRCETVRTEGVIRQTGEIVWRNYSYPSEYKVPKGEGGFTAKDRNELRRAHLLTV